jgi:hypothetical protein
MHGTLGILMKKNITNMKIPKVKKPDMSIFHKENAWTLDWYTYLMTGEKKYNTAKYNPKGPPAPQKFI